MERAPFGTRTVIDVHVVIGDDLATPDAQIPVGSRPRIAAGTNLPDGALLLVELAGSGFRGQSRMQVVGGCAVSEPFAGTSGLAFGRYTATITMPVAEVQPSAVREVIGPHGEQLRGRLVRRGRMGTFVEATAALVVGGAAEAASADAASRAVQVVRHREIRDLVDAGRAMRGLRQPGAEAACGARMRDLQDRVRRIEAQVPSGAGGDLAALGALPTLYTCVSCVDDARAREPCASSDASIRGALPR